MVLLLFVRFVAGFFSALCSAPGFRPGGRLPFFGSPKKGSKERRPDAFAPRVARGALWCSVSSARVELAAFTSFSALKQAPRSQMLRALRACRRALRSSPKPTGPTSQHQPHLASHRARLVCASRVKKMGLRPFPHTVPGEAVPRAASLFGARAQPRRVKREAHFSLLLLGPRGRRRGAQGFGAAREARINL